LQTDIATCTIEDEIQFIQYDNVRIYSYLPVTQGYCTSNWFKLMILEHFQDS